MTTEELTFAPAKKSTFRVEGYCLLLIEEIITEVKNG